MDDQPYMFPVSTGDQRDHRRILPREVPLAHGKEWESVATCKGLGFDPIPRVAIVLRANEGRIETTKKGTATTKNMELVNSVP